MSYLITLYIESKDEFITDCSNDIDGVDDLSDRVQNVAHYYEEKFLSNVKIVSVALLGGLE